MEAQFIRHQPRHIDFTLSRFVEIEHECVDCPDGEPERGATCADCGSTMVYRGIGRLRGGTHVHYFECVHSPREVHGYSLIIGD